MSDHARDIMTPNALCIGENESLFLAARLMARFDVGALPIRGEDDRLRGLITDRDIVVEVLAEGVDPRWVYARELARGKPVTVRADASVEDVIGRMKASRVKRLPVIDGEKHLVGMVTQSDIARNADGSATGDLVRSLSREE
jgi:CBS domain-containing protein